MTTLERKRILDVYKKTGGNAAETARLTGRSAQTVRAIVKVLPSTRALGHNGKTDATFVREANIPEPKYRHQLTEQEKGWLADFGAFRSYFFEGTQTPPFQTEIAATVSAAEHDRYLVLCPPGHGKTHFFSFHFAIWMMIRARVATPLDDRGQPSGPGWSCLMVSKSTTMAKAFLSQIKKTLEQNVLLQAHYGRFKPEYPDVWKQDAILVDGFPTRKDHTFLAAGAQAQIYGWRCPLVLGDDIVDTDNSSTPERAEKLANWHADEMMSRVEPGGVAVMVGTRFNTFDLYGRLLRQRDDDDNPIWYPLVYKAHDESRCDGEHCPSCREGCTHDEPYPDGCVLWPARWGYNKLRRLRSGQTTGARFEFLYNQAEVPEEDALVKPAWVEACKNLERTTWEGPRRGVQLFCTIDPSPTNWAVAQFWAYEQGADRLWLVAQHRRKSMRAPEYLALMRSWEERIVEGWGQHPTWIVEINAAQRFLFQSRDYQMMKLEVGLQVKEHTTGRNKADPDYGVQTISPYFEFCKVDLPWKDPETRREVAPLVDELISYPGETTDCVMALWFCVHNVKRMSRSFDIGQFIDYPDMPRYLNETRELVDLRTGQRQRVG